MQRAIVLTLFLGLPVTVLGNECSAGYKHHADLTGLMCMDATKDAANCNSECCKADTATCGGVTGGVTCASDSYAANTDAWKKTATTEKDKKTKCCAKKATCGSGGYSCKAYETKTVTATSVKCTGDAASCALSQICCPRNIKTCGGNLAGGPPVAVCAAGRTLKTTTDFDTKDEITGTPTPTKFNTGCCVPNECQAAKDSGHALCPKGQKEVAVLGVPCTDALGAATKKVKDCSGTDATLGDTGKNTCCVADTLTCGGAALPGPVAGPLTGSGFACDAGTYMPDSYKGTAVAAGLPAYKSTCCKTVATCAQGTCPAGYKSRKDVGTSKCTTDTASCATGTGLTTCCQLDTNKCGGLSGISCAYGTFDESTLWNTKTTDATKNAWNNKAANETNKNTNCCTAREACALPIGTTTPAPAVVTTTPAAPALKFSEHKKAVEEGSDRPWGANMVWLGVGGMIGMGVLMVVQGLRTRVQAAQADAEDADALLGTSE